MKEISDLNFTLEIKTRVGQTIDTPRKEGCGGFEA